jgi:hypothetical protein
MKTKRHTIKGASLECIEEYTNDIGGDLPDWVPYMVAVEGTETSNLDAALVTGQHFSGLLRSCSNFEYVQEGRIEDEDGNMHNIEDLLDEAAERLDQAHEEWALTEALHRNRKHLLDRDEIALLGTILMTYCEDCDSDEDTGKAVDALWNKIREAKA